jgi:hypothetical protein
MPLTLTRIGRALALALLAVALAAPTAALAQSSDALQRVQERAKYINDFKALLTHSDAAVRFAAVQEALNGDDPDLRSMAIEVALGSQDDKLQTAALRWILSNRENLNVKVELPEKPSKAQEYVYNLFHGLVLTKIKVEPKSDEIRLDNGNFKAGQLVRGGLELTFAWGGNYSCVMSARPTGGMLLTGSVTCTIDAGRVERDDKTAQRASIPVRIDLS